jgi:hypothetical protein
MTVTVREAHLFLAIKVVNRLLNSSTRSQHLWGKRRQILGALVTSQTMAYDTSSLYGEPGLYALNLLDGYLISQGPAPDDIQRRHVK